MQLEYILRRPTVQEGRPPLLVLLHGQGGDETGMSAWAQSLDPRLMTLSLRAPHAHADAGYRWFSVRFAQQAVRVDSAELETSRLAVTQCINDAVMGFGADPRRVYVLGFSQGATLAYGLVMSIPHKLRGVVAMAGRLLPEFPAPGPRPLEHLTLFIQHGTKDPVIALTKAQAARDTFLENGAMLGYREYHAAHELHPAMREDAAEFLTHQLNRLDARIAVTTVG